MTTITDMRASIESIKAELGTGEIVMRTRCTGKTTALLEFVHEYCSGFCYLVTCTPVMAEITKHRYKELYPDDEQPIICTLSRLRGQSGLTHGRPRAWVTDEVWPSAAEQAENSLGDLTFLGGVGTVECMEMHSR
jgi:hypothetical protein